MCSVGMHGPSGPTGWRGANAGSVSYVVGRQAGELLRLAGATLAAVGFFVAARPDAPQSSDRFARRERLLAWAFSLLVLSAALFAGGTISMDRIPSWMTPTFWWITSLGGLQIVPPAILAAIGFALSRRSLRRPSQQGHGRALGSGVMAPRCTANAT